jgi:ribonuclease VapC
LIVVDTSALVAVVRHEPERKDFLDIINTAESASISIVTVVETASVVCGRRLMGTRAHVEQLVESLGLIVQVVDDQQQSFALDALLTFGRGRHPAKLNLGDCFAYALAKTLNAPLLFKGDDFAKTDIVPAWRPL